MKYDFGKIGERIRQERKKLRLSQEDFISKLNDDFDYHIGRNRLSDIENGNPKGEISLTMLSKMAEMFGCEIGYILCEYDQKTREATDIHTATGLSGKAIETIQGMKRARDKSSTAIPSNDGLDALDKILSHYHKGGSEVYYTVFGLIHEYLGAGTFERVQATKAQYIYEHNGHIVTGELAQGDTVTHDGKQIAVKATRCQNAANTEQEADKVFVQSKEDGHVGLPLPISTLYKAALEKEIFKELESIG